MANILLKNGITSAQQIAALSKEQFIKDFKSKLGEEKTKEIYKKALAIKSSQ